MLNTVFTKDLRPKSSTELSESFKVLERTPNSVRDIHKESDNGRSETESFGGNGGLRIDEKI